MPEKKSWFQQMFKKNSFAEVYRIFFRPEKKFLSLKNPYYHNQNIKTSYLLICCESGKKMLATSFLFLNIFKQIHED